MRELGLQLALVFDDRVALNTLRQRAASPGAAAKPRNAALQALLAKGDSSLAPLLLQLIVDPATRNTALRGLASYDHPATASTLINAFPSFDDSARRDAVQTLASRAEWALRLLDAVEAKRIPRTELTAYTARQLRSLGIDEITARTRALWGAVRATPDEKLKLIETYKRQLTPESLSRADPSAGRLIYQKTCANCHRLFDAGGNVGPEITGAQRTNLDYLLENLLDPSATVSKDFQMEVVHTTNGRVITGLVISETASAVTIQTVNERVIMPVDEIDERATSPVSMMPDGMLQELSTQQVRELFAYLGSSRQVPIEDAETSAAESRE